MQFCAHRRRRSALCIVFLCIFSLIFCINVSAGSNPFVFNLWSADNYKITLEDLNSHQYTLTMSNLRSSYDGNFTLVKNNDPITTSTTDHYFRNFVLSGSSSNTVIPVSSFNSNVIYFYVTLSIQSNLSYFESGSVTSAYFHFFTNATLSTSSYIPASFVSGSYSTPRTVGALTQFTVLFKVDFSTYQNRFIYGFSTGFSTNLRERYPSGVTSDNYSISFSLSNGFVDSQADQAAAIHSAVVSSLDEFFNSGPTPLPMDYSSIDAMNQAEAGLRDALPNLGDASSEVLAGFQGALGDHSFLAGMRGIKYMLEASTSTGFLKILLTCSISFGAIAFLVGLGFSVIRRS